MIWEEAFQTEEEEEYLRLNDPTVLGKHLRGYIQNDFFALHQDFAKDMTAVFSMGVWVSSYGVIVVSDKEQDLSSTNLELAIVT